MRNKQKSELFRQIVGNKFQIYNSLFSSLPYDNMNQTGMLIPLLYEESKSGYEKGNSPSQIMQQFFEKHSPSHSLEEKMGLLFRMIQYIERQVVLFDSVEDAAFSSLHSAADKGTIENMYQKANAENKLSEVQKKLASFGVKVVFTAHPTQFYPNAVQRIMHDLRQAIKDDSVSKIDMLLQQLGKTPFVNESKPTPLDEAESIIYYLRYVYYDTLGELYREVKALFGDEFINDNENLFQLGFWPGGDRDGNPFVHASTTFQVAESLRIAILKCYYNHLKFLRRRLTFREVSEKIATLLKELYANIFFGKHTLTKAILIDKVQEMRQVVLEQHNGVFVHYLDDFLGRIKLFGMHFASLDIRQDSSVHVEVISQIFKQEFHLDYQLLSDDEKINYLTQKQLTINPADYQDALTKDTIENVYQLKEVQRLNGLRGIHRYIISNSETIFDVLHVLALFNYCGYTKEEISFDIVPLFETIKGLDEAQHTMNKLYQLPIYTQHLDKRKRKQYVMLGFSDGTKDGGYLKANWEIYKTKEQLTSVAVQHEVDVVFFDGRGGPPARGGGKTNQFYASQGKSIANNQIELTIQGQTITSVFGTKPQATYNFEQLLTAGIENDSFDNPLSTLSSQQRKLFDELANTSYQKYVELKSHEQFVPYLENMSTLHYYGKTNIGSRPSKRGQSDQLEFSKLRAIPFVGSWSLLKQNVPGYYGIGSAIRHLEQQGRIQEVIDLYHQSSFFKTLVQNSMMSMAKTYFPLTQYMKSHERYGEFWCMVHDEFLLSKQLLLQIAGHDTLMQEEPVSKASIRLREHIVLPLLTIQQYALQQIQEQPEHRELFEKLVMRSLFGNINASRNSA